MSGTAEHLTHSEVPDKDIQSYGLICSDQGPGGISTAQFTVMVRPNINDTANPLVAVRDALREERAGCATEFVDFSIGRTLVIVEDDHIQMSVTPVGQQIDQVHHVQQIQVVFPLIDRSELAFFALSTECLIDWDDYIDMMAGICKTITWNETTSGEIASTLDGLAGPN